jgi:hypothetical protein
MKTAKTIQERLAQIPDSHKAKMMFLIEKRHKQEKKNRLRKLFNSLFDVMFTLGRILIVWIIIFIPIELCISILSQHNIIPIYIYHNGIDYIGWIIFIFSCIYGVKSHLLLRKFRNRKEK